MVLQILPFSVCTNDVIGVGKFRDHDFGRDPSGENSLLILAHNDGLIDDQR